MSSDYEFRAKTPFSKVLIHGLRGFVMLFMGFVIYSLGTTDDPDMAMVVDTIGSVFVLVWIHANLLQVRVEIQELFVHPYNTLNGIEFMFVGTACLIAGLFL